MKKCIKGYEVKVMKSPAGYYLGTCDEDGFSKLQDQQLLSYRRNCIIFNTKQADRMH